MPATVSYRHSLPGKPLNVTLGFDGRLEGVHDDTNMPAAVRLSKRAMRAAGAVACPTCGEQVRGGTDVDHFRCGRDARVGDGLGYKARDTLRDRFVALKLLRGILSGEVDHTSQLQQRGAASLPPSATPM